MVDLWLPRDIHSGDWFSLICHSVWLRSFFFSSDQMTLGHRSSLSVRLREAGKPRTKQKQDAREERDSIQACRCASSACRTLHLGKRTRGKQNYAHLHNFGVKKEDQWWSFFFVRSSFICDWFLIKFCTAINYEVTFWMLLNVQCLISVHLL